MTPPSDDTRLQYQALTGGVGCARLGPRTQIEITGRDRAQFLHGMSTNDILALNPGQGCEVFLTDVQGKIAAYGYLFCGEQALVFETAADQAARIIAGLDRYIIREDVQLHDRSQCWAECIVCGPQSESLWTDLIGDPIPEQPCSHRTTELNGSPISLRRVPFAGPDCFFLSCDAERADELSSLVSAAGATVCGAEAVEIRRIESGSPLYGLDITSDNLPQEVNRNAWAISFTKGCYLGQETVARIDALGHVNRTLTGLAFDSQQIPPVGSQLTAHEKTVARVTSTCWSLERDRPLALAYVRRGHNRTGNRFSTDWGTAEVVTLGGGPEA